MGFFVLSLPDFAYLEITGGFLMDSYGGLFRAEFVALWLVTSSRRISKDNCGGLFRTEADCLGSCRWVHSAAKSIGVRSLGALGK